MGVVVGLCVFVVACDPCLVSFTRIGCARSDVARHEVVRNVNAADLFGSVALLELPGHVLILAHKLFVSRRGIVLGL